MDFDFCDYDDMQDDSLQNANEFTSHTFSDEEGFGHDISFTGHIDDFYDSKINSANDNLTDHTEDLLHAKTADEAQSALDRIKNDRRSVDYWEDCKRSALIDSEKNKIFLDGINAKLEIIERYRK